MGDLSGRRIVVPETRELGQLVRMLQERGADTVLCPMIAIRDAPDPAPVEAWLRRFAKGTCDDLVLMTGEGLRRLLGFARRFDLEPAFLSARLFLRLCRIEFSIHTGVRRFLLVNLGPAGDLQQPERSDGASQCARFGGRDSPRRTGAWWVLIIAVCTTLGGLYLAGTGAAGLPRSGGRHQPPR
jgi:Uroporphyrinogen-III synthase HemD